MPHVIIKLAPGRSEQQKIQLAGRMVREVVAVLQCGEDAVSVAFEEIPLADWMAKVYQPDILAQLEKLYKQPGYTM